jgi:hypothetical protein
MNANEAAIAEANRISTLTRLGAFLRELERNPEITCATLIRIQHLYRTRKAQA